MKLHHKPGENARRIADALGIAESDLSGLRTNTSIAPADSDTDADADTDTEDTDMSTHDSGQTAGDSTDDGPTELPENDYWATVDEYLEDLEVAVEAGISADKPHGVIYEVAQAVRHVERDPEDVSGERPVENAGSRYAYDGGQRQNALPDGLRGRASGRADAPTADEADYYHAEGTGALGSGDVARGLGSAVPRSAGREAYERRKEEPGGNFGPAYASGNGERAPRGVGLGAAGREIFGFGDDGDDETETRENAGETRGNYAGIPGSVDRTPDRDSSGADDYPAGTRPDYAERQRSRRARQNAEQDSDDGGRRRRARGRGVGRMSDLRRRRPWYARDDRPWTA